MFDISAVQRLLSISVERTTLIAGVALLERELAVLQNRAEVVQQRYLDINAKLMSC